MMGEVIRVSGRGPDVGDLLREAMVSGRFADLTLCCSGGQRFMAHRLVLSAASPYLQDVLLAHGKSAGNCEPITVILAEVEGPELAAVLSFVYTGSATVPRCRLEAFARAAETLHVRIPSVGQATFDRPDPRDVLASDRYPDDCPFDNVKIEETKIDSRYLRCEQYPSYDKCWFDSTVWPFDGCIERFRPNEWGLTGSERVPRTYDETSANPGFDRNFVDPEIRRATLNDVDEKFPDVRTDGPLTSKNLPIVDRYAHERGTNGDRSDDGSYEYRLRDFTSTGPTVSIAADRESRTDKFHGFDDFVSRTSGWETAQRPRDDGRTKSHREAETRLGNNDFDAAAGIGESARLPSLPVLQHHRTTGRSSVTFDKQDYDGTADAGGPDDVPSASTSATVTSGVAVTDPTDARRTTACRESCCGWRSPRRHVANRVPASPWSQLARPAHNSPKYRTIVRRNRDDGIESSDNRWTESDSIRTIERTSATFRTTTIFDDRSTSASSSSVPLNLRHEIPASDRSPVDASPYNFQVPETTEIPSIVDANARFVDERRTTADFYEPTVYRRIPTVFAVATIPPIADRREHDESIAAADARRSVVDFNDVAAKNSRLRSATLPEVAGASNLDGARGVDDRHAIALEANDQRRTVNDPPTCDLFPSPRIELSHPISRLCDSIRLNNGDIVDGDESSTVPTSRETIESTNRRVDEARMFVVKSSMSPIEETSRIHSDSNNNESTVDVSGISINSTASIVDGTKNSKTIEGPTISEDHRCEQCGKTFVTRASLKVHGRTHSGEKPFRCNDCGKEFSQLRNYKYHRSVHEGTREFAATCTECGKYFNDRGYLSSHMKIHRNRKEYACAECGKSFNQRVAYNMHVRIHTGIKPHQCEQCGKAFSRKMLLKQHLRTHSGERPYQCQICQKAFADRSNMTLHTRLHSGLKPYQCTLCTKAFTKKHHLKTHLNYHTGTKPYSCPNCSLRFSQSSNMRTHYKKCLATMETNAKSSAGRSTNGDDDNRTSVDVQNRGKISNDVRAVTSGSGRTNALTPPSSDHESSILTPVSDELCQSDRNRSSRSKIDGKSVNDV